MGRGPCSAKDAEIDIAKSDAKLNAVIKNFNVVGVASLTFTFMLLVLVAKPEQITFDVLTATRPEAYA